MDSEFYNLVIVKNASQVNVEEIYESFIKATNLRAIVFLGGRKPSTK